MAKGGALKWLGLAALVVGGIFLAKKASAAAAAAPTADPTKTNAQLLQSWSDYLHQVLNKYGYSTQAAYTTANSGTEQIIDMTGAGRNLVLKNQSITDRFAQFMWPVKAAFTFKTWDPNATDATSAAQFSALKDSYSQLVQDFSPTFLQ